VKPSVGFDGSCQMKLCIYRDGERGWWSFDDQSKLVWEAREYQRSTIIPPMRDKL
jgi:hypothetical protein